MHIQKLHTFVALIYPVKEFDTVNHDLIIDIVEQYESPRMIWCSITKMYIDLEVVLKLGEIGTRIEHKMGVRQGDCMETLLYILLVIELYKTMEVECII